MSGLLGTTFAIVHAGKLAFDKWRPDGSDTNSYPSGHTAAAFSGAAFIQSRYGTNWGLPAYTFAFYTGISRVKGQRHYFDDVLAGGAIAVLVNWAFVTPIGGGTQVRPVVNADGVGVEVTTPIGPKSDTPKIEKGDYEIDHWRFSLEMGPDYQTRNDIRNPASGTNLALHEIGGNSYPQYSSQIFVELEFANQHEVAFIVNPLDIRDNAVSTTPTSFAGTTFSANIPLAYAYYVDEYRARYRFDSLGKSKCVAKAGIAVSLFDLGMTVTDGTTTAEATEIAILPLLHGYIGYEFNDEWKVFSNLHGIALDEDRYLELDAKVRWQFAETWDVSAGYRYANRILDTDDIYNHVIQQKILLEVGHSF